MDEKGPFCNVTSNPNDDTSEPNDTAHNNENPTALS